MAVSQWPQKVQSNPTKTPLERQPRPRHSILLDFTRMFAHKSLPLGQGQGTTSK
jgi:hypothetical protein